MATLFSLSPSPLVLLAIALTVTLAYVIFGMAGFGTALIAAPVLAQCLPLAAIVPLLALLDFAAAAVSLARNRKAADLSELKRLAPALLLGSAAGAALLLLGRPQSLLLALGLFAAGYAVYSLSGYRPARRFTPAAALPFGFAGGVFSALFGSGGFIYAIYLAGRIDDNARFRVTQSTLIGLATLTRVALFLFAGVYANADLLILAALLLPAMLIGTAIGQRLTLRLSRAQFLRIVSVIVLVSGLALIGRYLMA